MTFDFRSLPHVPCVYLIRNNSNGRFYIGSAKNLHKRSREHKNSLLKNKHCNRFLQNDFNKCGERAFSIDILEKVDMSNLILKEQSHLDRKFDNQKQCYNICPKAYSSLGRKASDKTKQKQSSSMMGKNKGSTNGMFGKTGELSPRYGNKDWLGKNHSRKTKAKMSVYWKTVFQDKTKHPNFGKPNKWGKHTEETKKIISSKMLGKRLISIYQISRDGTCAIKYESVNGAANITGIGRTSISNCLRKQTKSAGSYQWKYSREVEINNVYV